MADSIIFTLGFFKFEARRIDRKIKLNENMMKLGGDDRKRSKVYRKKTI